MSLKDLKKDVKKDNPFANLKKDLADASPFLKWEAETTADGAELKGKYKPITGKLVGYERKKQTFKDKNTGVEKEQVRYHFKLAIDGRERVLSTGQSCATAIAAVVEDVGAEIRITRSGEGFDTAYKVELV